MQRHVFLILASSAGLLLTICVCISASMKASALSGVTIPIAMDYLNHLRCESWIALSASALFGTILVCCVVKRLPPK